MPNVFSPRDLVSRPDNMDETVIIDISKGAISHHSAHIFFRNLQIEHQAHGKFEEE